MISCSIIELVKCTSQVRKIVIGLALKINGLYYRWIILFDLAYKIPRLFISNSISVILLLKNYFLACLVVEQKKDQLITPSLFIGLYCSSVLIVLPLFRISVLWNALDTNNLYFPSFYLSDFILILFFFSFFFWTMKRHVTLQSHDRSHDVTS